MSIIEEDLKARKNFVSLQTAAKQYELHPMTLRRWAADGRITLYRFGPRQLRLDAGELARVLIVKEPTA